MRVCAQTLGVFDLIQTLELKLAVFVACHSIDLRWCFPCGFFVSWSCWCLLPCGYKRLSDWRKTTVPYCFNHFWSFLICNAFYIFRWFNATKQDRPNIKLTSLDSWIFSVPSWPLPVSNRQYMISAALIASGLLSLVQILRWKLIGGYTLGTGLISAASAAFGTDGHGCFRK